MNPPLWKRIVSYFYTFEIEKTSSFYNSELQVRYANGRFQLCTANAIYSYGDLYDNFSKSFERLSLGRRHFKTVLLLGFGLGSIPFMLERKFGKKYHYTAVEIDEIVLQLAQKYVVADLNSPIDFICADAAAYVAQTERQFDLICMDVFLDDVVPSVFEQPHFLETLRQRLQPNTGLLLYNRLTTSDLDKKNTRDYYHRVFQKVFPDATYFDVDGNWMLVNKTTV